MTNTYADIRPDSPWRWVPLVCFPIAFILIGVMQATADLPAWTWLVVLCVAAFVLGTISHFMIGLGAVDKAERFAWTTGGVRLNTHPKLAVTLRIVGAVLLLDWGVAEFGSWRGVTPTASLDREPVLLFFMLGGYLTLSGWTRPWDLKVVERGDRGAEVTA